MTNKLKFKYYEKSFIYLMVVGFVGQSWGQEKVFRVGDLIKSDSDMEH